MDKDVAIALIGVVGGGSVGAIIKSVLDYRVAMKEKRRGEVRAQLIHHPIFAQLDEIEYYFERIFKLQDPGRTILVSEMVVNKVRIWKKTLLKAAEYMQTCCDKCEHSADGAGCNKLGNYLVSVFLEGMEAYTDWHKKPGVSSIDGGIAYDAVSIATMDMYIEKFKEWHSAREEVVQMATHDIANSTVLYESCYNKMWDVLSVYMYAFVEMKLDAEKTIKSLNGSLTGKKIFSVTIGDAV